MARPIYGVNDDSSKTGCCNDLQDIGDYISKNTQILYQLVSTRDKILASNRLKLVVTEIEARLASSASVYPITTNVPGMRGLNPDKKKDLGKKNPGQ
jgi:hypothetical protein